MRRSGVVAHICVALACWSLRNRNRVLLGALALVLTGAAGVLSLGFDPDPRVYFSKTAPERVAMAQITERYGESRDIIAIVRSPSSGADDGAVRDAAEGIAAALDDVEGVASTRGALAGFGDGIRMLPTRDGPPIAAFSIAVTAGSAQSTELVSRIQSTGDEAAGRAGNFELLLTGEPAQEAASLSAIKSDLLTYVPLEVAIIVILLLIALGSISATAALLCVLAVATALTMGLYGFTGASLNGVSAAVPSSLLGLSVATSVHLILAWQHGLRKGHGRYRALLRSVRLNARPVVVATVTTILSFLCLNFADSPAFHTFGNLVAAGLCLTLLLSFTLLPALISVIPANPAPARARVERRMAALGAWVANARLPLLVAGILTLIVSGYGVSQIVFRDNFAAYFDDRYAFRQATTIYEERGGGITPVEFSIPRKPGETLLDIAYLRDIADFTTWAERQPHVSSVVSLTELLADAGSEWGLTGSDGVPASLGAAEQLQSALLGRGDDPALQSVLGTDFASEKDGPGATRVIVVMRQASSEEILQVAHDGAAKLRELDAARAATGTGMPVLAANLSTRNGQAMLKATPVALAGISLLLVFALSSWKLGLASLVPNLMPLLMAYGIWGYVMGELTFAGTMVIAMTFGIVVDDTVHMMSRYHHLRGRGIDPVAAMTETFRTVGIAVLVTTLAIASGFSVLGLSGFLVNRDLGLITSMTLLSALVATLLFLPPLLLLIDRARGTHKAVKSPADERTSL